MCVYVCVYVCICICMILLCNTKFINIHLVNPCLNETLMYVFRLRNRESIFSSNEMRPCKTKRRVNFVWIQG